MILTDLTKTKQDIEAFLMANRRVYNHMAYYFADDCNYQPVHVFKDAKLRVLVTQLSTADTRSCSNTFSCISTLMHEGSENWDDIFIDQCFLPEPDIRVPFNEASIPYMFGNRSHEPWWNYDVICVTQSIMSEVFNVPYMFDNSGVPLTMEQRVEKKAPLILYGGAAASLGGMTNGGKIFNDGKGLYDIGTFGAGEVTLPDTFKCLVKFNEEYGIKEHRGEVIEYLMNNSPVYDHYFIPNKYEVHFKDDNVTIESVDFLDPRTPERVKYGRMGTPKFKGFNHKYFNLFGANSDSGEIQISTGCSGSGACSFCMEAQENGHWLEKPLDQLKTDIQELKRYSAANSISPFSFNTNYYSKYTDMLYLIAANSAQFSVTNQRADVVGSNPEYLTLMKKLGINRMSVACEGMGERIRNKFLNKNLSKEQLVRCCSEIFKNKLMMVKFTMIITGQEKKEDVDEFCDELEAIFQERAKYGANTALGLTFTPLVIYPGTPLQWVERVTARDSYFHTRSQEYFIQRRNELEAKYGVHIKLKFHGKGCGTWLEQTIIDLGLAGTSFVVDASRQGLIYDHSFNDNMKQVAIDTLQKYGIDPEFSFPQRPLDYFFSCNLLDLNTETHYAEWKEQFKKNDYSHEICLVTPAHPKGKCHSCGYCKTPEEKLHCAGRKLESGKTIDDILEVLSESKAKYKVRVVVQHKPNTEIYANDTLAHYIASQFLRRDDALCDAFHSTGYISNYKLIQYYQPDYFGGLFCYEINFKTPVSASQLQPYVDEINNELESCRIVGVYDSDKSVEVKNTDEILWVGTIYDTSMSKITDKLSLFDWNIKVAEKSGVGGIELVPYPMPELKNRIKFVQVGTNIKVSMTLKADINPYLVLASILGKNFEYAARISVFDAIDFGPHVDATCSCGETLAFSQRFNKVNKLCRTCMGKQFLYKLTKEV